MRLTRRTLLVFTSAALAATTQAAKVPVVGILWHAGSEQEEVPYFDWIREGFRQQGYVDGENIVLEDRFPAERPELFDRFAADLVRKGVDVLLAISIRRHWRRRRTPRRFQ